MALIVALHSTGWYGLRIFVLYVGVPLYALEEGGSYKKTKATKTTNFQGQR